MSDADRGQAFVNARAATRDLAKWIISGVATIAVLIIGSSTISQLGTLELEDPRLGLAVTMLFFASLFWWRLFWLCLLVLRSEQHSLREFRATVADEGTLQSTLGSDGKRRPSAKPQVGEAMVAADALLLGQVPGGSLPALIDRFEKDRQRVVAGGADAETAKSDLQGLQDVYDFCGQVCLSLLMQLRFARLTRGLMVYVPAIIGCLLVFTWSANPAKEAVKLLDTPQADAPVLASAQTRTALIAAHISPKCLSATAQAFRVGTGPKDTVIDLLVPPTQIPPSDCKAHRVTLAEDQFVGLD